MGMFCLHPQPERYKNAHEICNGNQNARSMLELTSDRGAAAHRSSSFMARSEPSRNPSSVDRRNNPNRLQGAPKDRRGAQGGNNDKGGCVKTNCLDTSDGGIMPSPLRLKKQRFLRVYM